MITTNGTYPWLFVRQILCLLSHCGNLKTVDVMTSTGLLGIIGSVASLLAATLYQRNPDRNHKWGNLKSQTWLSNKQMQDNPDSHMQTIIQIHPRLLKLLRKQESVTDGRPDRQMGSRYYYIPHRHRRGIKNQSK